MLSTIVFCEDKPASPTGRDLHEVLARTLASLVTAKVEGILGDVTIAGPAEKGLGVVANHAGCALVEAENEMAWLALAVQAARGPNVFLLRCGRAPEAGFIEEAGDFLAANSKDTSPSQTSRPHPEEPRNGVSKDEPRALRGALVPHSEFIEGRDGLSGLVRMRAEGGTMAFETGSKSGTAWLRAVPESFIERVFPAAAPLAGLIAPRGLLLRVPRGGFQMLARCIGPATTFHARARRIG